MLLLQQMAITIAKNILKGFISGSACIASDRLKNKIIPQKDLYDKMPSQKMLNIGLAPLLTYATCGLNPAAILTSTIMCGLDYFGFVDSFVELGKNFLGKKGDKREPKNNDEHVVNPEHQKNNYENVVIDSDSEVSDSCESSKDPEEDFKNGLTRTVNQALKDGHKLGDEEFNSYIYSSFLSYVEQKKQPNLPFKIYKWVDDENTDFTPEIKEIIKKHCVEFIKKYITDYKKSKINKQPKQGLLESGEAKYYILQDSEKKIFEQFYYYLGGAQSVEDLSYASSAQLFKEFSKNLFDLDFSGTITNPKPASEKDKKIATKIIKEISNEEILKMVKS